MIERVKLQFSRNFMLKMKIVELNFFLNALILNNLVIAPFQYHLVLENFSL